MTSASVKDLSSLMTFVNPMQQAERELPGNGASFTDIFSKAGGENKDTENADTENIGSKPPEKMRNDSNVSEQSTAKPKDIKRVDEPKTEEPRELTEKEVGQINEKIDSAIKEVAEELDVTTEEVLEAMEILGMSAIAILDPSNMGELVMQIEGVNDPMEIVTDESLFNAVNDLTTMVDATVADLAESMDIEPEDIENFIKQAALDEQSVITPQVAGEMSIEVNSDPVLIEEPGVQDLPKKNANERTDDGIQNENETSDESKVNGLNGNETQQVSAIKEDDGNEDNLGKSSHEHSENHPEGIQLKNPINNNLINNIAEGQEANPVQESFVSAQTREIMDQILESVRVNIKPDMDQLEMQLHPASLGSVKVNLTHKAGEVTAEFKVANEQVKAAVENALNELRETFRASGTKVTAVEVSVEMQSFDSNLWQGKEHDAGSRPGEEKERRPRRIKIDELDALFEDEATDEEKLAAEMMKASGNTVDYTA